MFADMMIKDHTAVRKLGRDLVAKLKVTPTPPGADFPLYIDHVDVMKKLNSMTGADFDKFVHRSRGHVPSGRDRRGDEAAASCHAERGSEGSRAQGRAEFRRAPRGRKGRAGEGSEVVLDRRGTAARIQRGGVNRLMKTRTLVTLAAVLSAFAAGCSKSSPTGVQNYTIPPNGTPNSVVLTNNVFTPGSLSTTIGSTVTWTWNACTSTAAGSGNGYRRTRSASRMRSCSTTASGSHRSKIRDTRPARSPRRAPIRTTARSTAR